LQQIEPQNAAVWLLEFQHAAERGRAAEARAALARAAGAPEYRDYEDALYRTVLQVMLAPSTPARFAYSKRSDTSAEQARRWDADMLGWQVFFRARWEQYRWLKWTCDVAMGDGDEGMVRDCNTVARRMDVESSGMQSLQFARGLLPLLATDSDEQAQLVQRRREFSWLSMEGHPGKFVEASSHEAVIDQEVERTLAGMSYLERRRRMVADRGLTFPADYDDHSDDRPRALRTRCPPPMVEDVAVNALHAAAQCRSGG
jgi:hypothetical protein